MTLDTFGANNTSTLQRRSGTECHRNVTHES